MPGETLHHQAGGIARSLVTVAQSALTGLSFDDLADLAEDPGNGRGHDLASWVPRGDADLRGITPLGPDHAATRPGDRGGWLFDLGVTRGRVRMCVRTGDAALKMLLDDATGIPLLGRPDLLAAILHAQPHRVILWPAGRIEVFEPIPAPHDVPPEGSHAHLLCGLIASREVVVRRPLLPTAVLRSAPSCDYLRALDAAADVFRQIDGQAGEPLRPLVRIGLAALFQASRHVPGAASSLDQAEVELR